MIWNKEVEKKNKTSSRPEDSSGAKCSHDDSLYPCADLKTNPHYLDLNESPEVPKRSSDLNDSFQNYLENALDKSKIIATEIHHLENISIENIDLLKSPRDKSFQNYSDELNDKILSKTENIKSKPY